MTLKMPYGSEIDFMQQSDLPPKQAVEPAFEAWAIVEIFGHKCLAGHVREIAIAGTNMLEITVPAIGNTPEFVQMFGGSAVFSLTPVSEAIARAKAERIDARPVTAWDIGDVVRSYRDQFIAEGRRVEQDHQRQQRYLAQTGDDGRDDRDDDDDDDDGCPP